jgi:hypothetical protein
VPTPCIPPWTMGCSISSNSVMRVLKGMGFS